MLENVGEHFVGQVAQKVLVAKDGKILLVKNLYDDRWDFPGGRLHLNELPLAGIKREFQEEVGCECEVKGIISVGQYFHEHAKLPCVFINYLASIGEDEKILIAKDELSEYCWMNPNELKPEETFQNCTDALSMYLKL